MDILMACFILWCKDNMSTQLCKHLLCSIIVSLVQIDLIRCNLQTYCQIWLLTNILFFLLGSWFSMNELNIRDCIVDGCQKDIPRSHWFYKFPLLFYTYKFIVILNWLFDIITTITRLIELSKNRRVMRGWQCN